MKFLFPGKLMGSTQAKSFIENNFTFGRKGIGLGVICKLDSELLIGFAGILPCDYLGTDDFELGFALKKDYWRKGFATEIGTAQIEYGFTQLNLDRILALTHPHNIASCKIFEKLGMRLIRQIETIERGPRCIYMIEKNA
jgi:RimJ/RimL family protein N-acetyltransferase